VPILFGLFLFQFRERVGNAFTNIANENHQEYLFLIFLLVASVVSIYTLLKKWSLIPILGVLFCSYLLIEIPVKSWFVFFGWMALGLLIYFSYGNKKSKLA
jgi:basic amino acid/polyamine antiporter, APA family